MYKMKVTVTLVSLLSLIILFNLTSAVLVETCGPNAVYRREDGTRARRGWLDCWTTWSRCSGWSKIGTGTIWETCPDCCKKQGHRGGSCKLHPSKCPLSSEAYVCDCY